LKTVEQGAYSTLHALLAPVLEEKKSVENAGKGVVGGGVYFHGEPYYNVSAAANDVVAAKRLWDVSADITGLKRRLAELAEEEPDADVQPSRGSGQEEKECVACGSSDSAESVKRRK